MYIHIDDIFFVSFSPVQLRGHNYFTMDGAVVSGNSMAGLDGVDWIACSFFSQKTKYNLNQTLSKNVTALGNKLHPFLRR